MNIPALTGARFFAAAAIVLWHSQLPPFFRMGAFWPFDMMGGVPFFFVLSGFVLTINAEKYHSHLKFMIARIARVWPAHVAAIAFLFFIFWPYSRISLWEDPAQFRILWVNVALLQAWIPDRSVYWSLNAPSWSVSVEMAFYLAFPAVLALMRRRAIARILLLTTMVIMAQAAVWTLSPTIDPVWLGHFNPLANAPLFAIGVATGAWFKRNGRASGDGTGVQFAALALMIAANAAFHEEWLSWLPSPVRTFVATSAAGPAYAALILALARYDGAPSRFLARSPAVFLGEISYSLYLFHQPVLRWRGDHAAAFAGIPVWVQYVGVWAACLGIATASYLLAEKPGRSGIVGLGRFMTNRFDARRSQICKPEAPGI